MYTEQMYENSLCHYGVKGQKWGDRRFQNLDGTYTALGERRRLETLARTGTSVKPTSALANRQAQARTGNVVRVNSVNRNTTSKPLSRPVTTSTGASKVVLDKATGTVKHVPASVGSPAAKKTVVTRPTAKIVTSEEAQKAKKKLAKASTETTDEEETKTTKKKTSAKKKSTKKTKAQKEAEQKAKEAQEQAAKEQEQQNQEEKKDETQNEGPLSEEQVQDYARRVIRGEFGNGQERKDKLGDKYAQVQALVNALLLKGRKK